MSTLRVRLPNSLHRALCDLAKEEGVSVDQLVSSAVAEKLAALVTVSYLEERARRGSADCFDAILKKVPSSQPVDQDKRKTNPGPAVSRR